MTPLYRRREMPMYPYEMALASHPHRTGRVDVAFPVAIEMSGEAFGGLARNLGIGGMFVAADRVSGVGAELILTFSVPGQSERVSVRGEVRWVRASFVSEPGDAPGMGIRFVDLTFDTQIALAGVIRKAEAAGRSANDA